MSEFDAAQPSTEVSGEEFQYRSVDGWSVTALLMGLLSILALLHPMLWLIPPLGLLAGLLAMGSLRRNPDHVGRGAALLGLGLSVLFGVAPIAQTVTSHVLLARQSQPLAYQFFRYLRENAPEKALMLRFVADARQPLDDSLWIFYRHDTQAQKELRGFVNDPLIRTLLALGDRAQVRYVKTTGLGTAGPMAEVFAQYMVTYTDDDGHKKSFPIDVFMERRPPQKPGLSPWHVKHLAPATDPAKAVR